MTVKNPAIKPRNNALKDTRGDKIFFVINAIFLGLTPCWAARWCWPR